MKFTYEGYGRLLDLFQTNGFVFSKYTDSRIEVKSCILRHDIDLSIPKALQMAEYEASRSPHVESTFFVLLKTDFYNPASRNSVSMLREINSMGHQIGLHFDEASYDSMDQDTCCRAVLNEARILENILEIPIRAVSMHRPSPLFLKSNYKFNGLINAYDNIYFKDYKYLSDSRRRWREDPLATVESGEYNKFQILTHPIWYDSYEVSAQKVLGRFISCACEERRLSLDDNIRDLDSLLKERLDDEY